MSTPSHVILQTTCIGHHPLQCSDLHALSLLSLPGFVSTPPPCMTTATPAEQRMDGSTPPPLVLSGTPQPYRFRRAWTCLKPSSVWSLFTPYKTLCEADAGLIHALQDRREMFCITDPDLYDNPISKCQAFSFENTTNSCSRHVFFFFVEEVMDLVDVIMAFCCTTMMIRKRVACPDSEARPRGWRAQMQHFKLMSKGRRQGAVHNKQCWFSLVIHTHEFCSEERVCATQVPLLLYHGLQNCLLGWRCRRRIW